MITKQEIIKTEFFPAINKTWVWSDDFYLDNINPQYSYFLYCTLHIPTDIWRKGKSLDISNKMCKIILHRYYDIDNPSEYWDKGFDEGEREVVYKGFIRDKKHLKELIKDLGIIENN